jgi:hypothetical protein
MKKINENQLEKLEGGRFWGWSCGSSYSIEQGSCYRTCVYRAFWTAVPSTTTVVTCGNEPGSNPSIQPSITPN